jgi:hypothetical protein
MLNAMTYGDAMANSGVGFIDFLVFVKPFAHIPRPPSGMQLSVMELALFLTPRML